MNTELNFEEVVSIVQSIFSTMLGLEVSPVDDSSLPRRDRITASVYLEGAWKGAVYLECGTTQACAFAAGFLGIDPPLQVDDDVRDVMGELANMIGGNVKSTMGADVRLSLPSVIEGSDYELRICGSAVLDRVAFQFDSGHFWVTIVAEQTGRIPQAAKNAVAEVRL